MPTSTASTLTRALAAKQEARYQQEILEGLGRDPSFARDVAYDAFCDAISAYRHIIQTEWDARRMERYLPHVGLSTRVAA